MKNSKSFNSISFAEKRLVYASFPSRFEGIGIDVAEETQEKEAIELNAKYFYQFAEDALNHYLVDNDASLGAKLFPLQEGESGEHLKQRKVKEIAEKLNVALNRDKLRQVLQRVGEIDRALLVRGLAYEVAESICSNMILEDQANKDHLTKLPNKRAFEERLREAIAQQDRHAQQFCVLMIDLDKFKAVNDVHGHLAGDEVLIEIGKRFKKLLRECDFAARYGGDEFVMILSSTNPNAASKAAFRIIEEMQKPIIVKNGTMHIVTVGATIGVGKFESRDSDTNGEAVIRSADDSLRYLKNNELRGKVAYNEHVIIPPKEKENDNKTNPDTSDQAAQQIEGEVFELAINQ